MGVSRIPSTRLVNLSVSGTVTRQKLGKRL